MRVADRDRADPAQIAYLADQVIVQVTDHVKEHVPGRGLHEHRALPDRGRGLGADPEHAGSLLLDPAPVPGGGELAETGPSLPVPAHVLAFVQADGAVLARGRVLHPAGHADRQVHIHDPGITDAADTAPGAGTSAVRSGRALRPGSAPRAASESWRCE